MSRQNNDSHAPPLPPPPETAGTVYRNPVPTADAIIEIGSEKRIVLIERRNAPLGWALPGGFVDYGESVASAAIREAREETGLEVTLIELFHVYANPTRDPRQHTVSTVFIATPAALDALPKAGDDAARAEIFSIDALPTPIVFDHATILLDYWRYREDGVRPPPDR